MQTRATAWENCKCSTEHHVNIKSSNDLRKFLEEAQRRLDSGKEAEEIFIRLEYFEEKLRPRETKERKQKERLTDYYVIKIGNYNNYLVKLTSRRIKYTGLCELTKQFKTERDAKRYKDKLIEKGFNINLSVEHIIA